MLSQATIIFPLLLRMKNRQGLIQREKCDEFINAIKLLGENWEIVNKILLKLEKFADPIQRTNSLKLSFTNIRGLRSNFVDCKSFHELNSPDIVALCETNWMTQLIL